MLLSVLSLPHGLDGGIDPGTVKHLAVNLKRRDLQREGVNAV